MFQVARALALAVAGGTACVVRVAHRVSVIAAEPDEAMIVRIVDALLRATLPDDAEDGAQLLAAGQLVGNHVRTAEDVVMRHADAVAGEHDTVGISALVDRRIGQLVVVPVTVPLVFAVAFAVIPDVCARTGATGDADRRRLAQAWARIRR